MDAFLQLAAVLEKEIARQRELLSLLTQERVAIVHLRQDELNKFQLKKQELIEQSKSIEGERDKIIALLVADPAQRAKLKLTELIERCPIPAAKNRLSHVRNELKSLATTTQDLNARNAELIRHALGVLGATMSLAFSAGAADGAPNYSRSGGLTDPLTSRRRTRSAA